MPPNGVRSRGDVMRRSVHADTGRGPHRHSWLSAAWKRNNKAIQSVLKPLVSKIPVVGDLAADRMLMSPTAAQVNLQNATNDALGSIGARVALVNAEANHTLPAPVGAALGMLPPGITGPQLALGAAVLVLLVFLTMRRK